MSKTNSLSHTPVSFDKSFPDKLQGKAKLHHKLAHPPDKISAQTHHFSGKWNDFEQTRGHLCAHETINDLKAFPFMHLTTESIQHKAEDIRKWPPLWHLSCNIYGKTNVQKKGCETVSLKLQHSLYLGLKSTFCAHSSDSDQDQLPWSNQRMYRATIEGINLTIPHLWGRSYSLMTDTKQRDIRGRTVLHTIRTNRRTTVSVSHSNNKRGIILSVTLNHRFVHLWYFTSITTLRQTSQWALQFKVSAQTPLTADCIPLLHFRNLLWRFSVKQHAIKILC